MGILTIIEKEAMEALTAPAQTPGKIFQGFQLWEGDLATGAIGNFDELILRDAGTPREEMWRSLRDGFQKMINDQQEAIG